MLITTYIFIDFILFYAYICTVSNGQVTMESSSRIKPRNKIKKTASKDEVESRGDEFGNLIICKNNGVRILISLKLRAEEKYRRIGVINMARKTIEMKRKRAFHLFYTTNSYGFNHKLLADAKRFEWVRLSDETTEWKIPVKFILDNGSFLNFKDKGGFELQIFVTLEQLKQFIRPAKF